jgi:hypothetical protein
MSADIAIIRGTFLYHRAEQHRYHKKYLMYYAWHKFLVGVHLEPARNIDQLRRIANRKYQYNLNKSHYHLQASIFWQNVSLFESGEIGYENPPSWPLRPSRHDFT